MFFMACLTCNFGQILHLGQNIQLYEEAIPLPLTRLCIMTRTERSAMALPAILSIRKLL